jgi:hypothetical protein
MVLTSKAGFGEGSHLCSDYTCIGQTGRRVPYSCENIGHFRRELFLNSFDYKDHIGEGIIYCTDYIGQIGGRELSIVLKTKASVGEGNFVMVSPNFFWLCTCSVVVFL